jgi:hypothetical protein
MLRGNLTLQYWARILEKYLCAMFGFQLGIVHISKDDAFEDNNNVTKSIY